MGDWDVSPIEGMLKGAQGIRHLQPKTMDVLVCLASQSGQVLTRDELISRVWNNHAVSDEPLTRCIHEIRRALGDPCGEARYIKTIPKRGYQLLPRVHELPSVASAPVSATPPESVSTPLPAPAMPLTSVSNAAVQQLPTENPVAVSVAFPEPVVDHVRATGAALPDPAGKKSAAAAEHLDTPGLFWEVTQQRVLWVGALYASLAWVFVQLIRYAELQTTAGRAFPDWLVPALVVIVLLGFPVAIFFAWVRQIAADQPDSARAPALTFNSVAALLWSRRGIDVVLVTLVIAGLAGFAFDFTPPVAAQVSGSQHKSIAVIPFTQATDEPDLEWLGASLAEDLQIRLRDYSALDLSERGRSSVAAAEQFDAQQLGQQLNVQYLLEGVVVTGDSGFRINVRLTDAATGFEVWSGYFSQPAAALAGIQQQIVTDIAAALHVDSSYARGSALPWSVDIAGNAYLSYLQGLYHLGNTSDKDAAARSAAWFDRALAEDERLVMASVGLCRAYTRELEVTGSAWAHGKANQVCALAVEQAPKLAVARLAQADYYRSAGFNRDATDQYEWVIAQQPANADAWRGLGMARSAAQLPDGADEAFRNALALRPQDARTHLAYTRFLLDERRYTDAVEVARKLVQLDRGSSNAYAAFAVALFNTGEFAAAAQAGRQAVAHDLENREAIITIAGSYYYLGKYVRAGTVYRQAARLLPDDPYIAGALANALAQIGGTKTAEQARAEYIRARQLAERALGSAQIDVNTTLALAFYCATLGDVVCAEEYQATAAEEGLDSDEQFYWSALVHAQMGNLEAASDAARAALERGYPQALILGDPLLARVWSQYKFATVRVAPFASSSYQPE